MHVDEVRWGTKRPTPPLLYLTHLHIAIDADNTLLEIENPS
ncbi:hypothetical protein [Leptolyngbya sp. FACHB-16]|nr:hypothetical protein [Leptolyngbya sp. FACHB-16]